MRRAGSLGVALAAVLLVPAAARDQEPGPARAAISYRIEPVAAATFSKAYTPAQAALLEKLNRRDVEHLLRLKEMIVPSEWRAGGADELDYSPLPATWAWAAPHAKVVVVSQPAQVFGAYEAGRLVRWGPVSSGRKETATPPGIYSLTWKTRSRRSTENQEWLLEWYFNFINRRGISFHKFDLPGYAASHACVRLLERDAQWLYDWGEQWKISADGRDVRQPGSTVVILGQYVHGAAAPWTALDWWTALPLTLPDDPPR
jgi:lipoprotein-anchoring transpeptidase ErfK/SrfK